MPPRQSVRRSANRDLLTELTTPLALVHSLHRRPWRPRGPRLVLPVLCRATAVDAATAEVGATAGIAGIHCRASTVGKQLHATAATATALRLYFVAGPATRHLHAAADDPPILATSAAGAARHPHITFASTTRWLHTTAVAAAATDSCCLQPPPNRSFPETPSPSVRACGSMSGGVGANTIAASFRAFSAMLLWLPEKVWEASLCPSA